MRARTVHQSGFSPRAMAISCTVLATVLARTFCSGSAATGTGVGLVSALQQDHPISTRVATSPSLPVRGQSEPGWRTAPTGLVTRVYPRLVNYHHMALPDGQVEHKEERLAQWDIVILNPDQVSQERLSLSTIRRTNPQVKILAWIPFGQEPSGMAIAQGIPSEGTNDWFSRRPNGQYVRPSWGGHFMNPAAFNNAWPKYAAEFVGRNYLQPDQYDGVLLDIMAEGNWMGADFNRDGVRNELDDALWQEGTALVTTLLRTSVPQAILTGNGGSPWSEHCPYFADANGDMHENALGDEFGVPGWDNVWRGYQTCMTRATPRPAVHFISVDVRNGRSLQDAKKLPSLTQDDLRRMRLGLGTTLLDDGYFGFDRGDCLHGQLWWFDEYDADLGQPLRRYQKDRYGSGTYSRDFQNGIVVVNPSGGAVTVTVVEALQDATTRQVARAFVVPANDAKIFVRPCSKP